MKPTEPVLTSAPAACYHCGDTVREEIVQHDGKLFCCAGCKAVYEILQRSDLCQYYVLEQTPGRRSPLIDTNRFAYLDEKNVVDGLTEFSDGTTASATFFVPQMHCSSCVWLLENLSRIDPTIISSRVDFLKKTITVRFQEQHTNLRRVVELLVSLGYEPELTFDAMRRKAVRPGDQSLTIRIGIAGFCFANVMLLSFPEYLSGGAVDPELQRVFTYLSLVLSLPALFYSGAGYFQSALQGLMKRVVNIDVPIALGISILFTRSAYEILTQTGPGFLDSLTGLIFFLLLGKLFQNKTYETLNFERDYRSYLPLAVLIKQQTMERTIPLASLKVGDRMLIRNNEVVPADAVLIRGDAHIDYSFVTGESRAVAKDIGDFVFAGGRQVGELLELEVVKAVSQSRLTQLWNQSAFSGQKEGRFVTVANMVSKYFTAAVLLIALVAGLVWLPSSPSKAMNAVTGVLIVACPCALALAVPFTFGTGQRIFGRLGFYLKNASVIESIARVTSVVFDKTGTLTHAQGQEIEFSGPSLTEVERASLASLVKNSHHPLSRSISTFLDSPGGLRVREFVEVPGAGIEAKVGGRQVSLGSEAFVYSRAASDSAPGAEAAPNEMQVYTSIDGSVRGYFALKSRYRTGVGGLVGRLRSAYDIALLSGDSDRERARLEEMLADGVTMHFQQTPGDKLAYISSMQKQGRHVLMVGDGLNDAGALRQADVGVALTEDIAAFSPAADAIMDARLLPKLDQFMQFSRTCVGIVLFSFGISFLYNLVALSFAFQGSLTPIMAAILMPLSSITVVLIATGAVQFLARRRGLF